MPEAVIVDAVRSPIGRAFKGSLTLDPPRRPRRLHGRSAARAQPGGRPRLDRGPDLRLRPAAGRAVLQHRPHHRAAVAPARLRDRHDRQPLLRVSLQAIRIAADAVMAGEGDAFIAAGVEHVSRVGMWYENGLPQLMGALQQQAPEGVRDPAAQPPEREAERRGRPHQRLHRHGHDGRERGGQVRREARGHGRATLSARRSWP